MNPLDRGYGRRVVDEPERFQHGPDARLILALGGTSGKRHTGSSNPISAIAAFTGMGFDSTK